MAQRGRPRKFDEPMVRRTFEIPERLNDRIKDMARSHPGYPQGRDDVDVVREALEAQLNTMGRSEQVCLDLPADTRAALESIATTLRYRELNHLIEDIACATLKYPPQSVYNFINPELTQRAAPTTSLQAADAYARQQMAEKAEKKRTGTWQPATPLPRATQGDSEPDKQAKKGAA